MNFYLLLVANSLLMIGNCLPYATNSPITSETGVKPQLVTLTFDDNVNAVNFPSYEELLMTGRKNKGDECLIKATFFVSHDYTDYQLVNQLYRQGSELAVHTISHSPIELMKKAKESLWQDEIVGMRTIMSKQAKIPAKEIKGFRAPFLQTGGNPTFRVLRRNGFTYDSSMPSKASSSPPMSPYSLDRGFKQDCTIGSCPTKRFKGLWEVPLVSWRSGRHQCSMVDACPVVPETVENILAYMKANFNRYYETNRAPFPVFLHQSWFSLPQRKVAYFKFIDWLLEKDDVFLVTISEVIDFLKKPVGLWEYKNKACKIPLEDNCDSRSTCHYTDSKPGGIRYMASCGQCPKSYPWTGNPLGL